MLTHSLFLPSALRSSCDITFWYIPLLIMLHDSYLWMHLSQVRLGYIMFALSIWIKLKTRVTDSQEVEKIASAYDETTRRVERGAKIVVAIQDAPKLVLQVSEQAHVISTLL
jgi:hypothetical protein